MPHLMFGKLQYNIFGIGFNTTLRLSMETYRFAFKSSLAVMLMSRSYYKAPFCLELAPYFALPCLLTVLSKVTSAASQEKSILIREILLHH